MTVAPIIRGRLVAHAFGAVDSQGEPQLHAPSDIQTRPNSMLNLLAAAGPAASLKWMDTSQDVFSTTLGDLDAEELQVYVAMQLLMCHGRYMPRNAGGCSSWRSTSRSWNGATHFQAFSAGSMPCLGRAWRPQRLATWMEGPGTGTWRRRMWMRRWTRC